MGKPQSYIEQLAEYIRKNIKKGYTIDSLRQSLLNQGYTRFSIEQAIQLANKKLSSEAPPMKEKPQILYKIVDDQEREFQVDVREKGLFSSIKRFFFG